ncbi:MAG TPA: glycoside hydrolase family 2 TIM barrel-domain containing protein, partial [Gemmatimonadaceae bacterium]|nr:glycoside hydrolase family 2 TIM barrel-domain containing protein [Gemmatimonadaceae bacterium]
LPLARKRSRDPAMRHAAFRTLLAALLAAVASAAAGAQAPRDSIPLPEHPRPDFERADWQNLNGRWRFRFDAADAGERAGWERAPLERPRTILVPFSWGAPLSGVPDSASIGWYERTITVPERWKGRRVYLVVGASDWRTSAWLDGAKLGDHQGGYTPFSLELTKVATPGAPQRLTLRVDDSDHPFKLEGKQGYGKARGIWQTAYLEARGGDPLETLHFTPSASLNGVTVEARLAGPAPAPLTLRVAFTNREGQPAVTRTIPRGASSVRFDVPLPDAHRWSLDDPFLHEVAATVSGRGVATDSVRSYFGMRTIGVEKLPGTSYPYVAINGKPVYLQLALDQAYHAAGFYTFPSDSFTRMEILRARQIGLNGLREHIKIETPRKLYWADRLGVLIMADVPNWWGPPTDTAFREHDYAMREMIARDYNHPAVFSWTPFNETWGLTTKVDGKEQYLPATQQRVIETVRLAKSLDATRLVEDNSVCCGRGHTVSDINSWHNYLPGFEWERHVAMVSDSTFPGSGWNFEDGYAQGGQPMINSEFGNVWGYEGSTGDVDWSWDYHMAIDAFRRHPKLAGWLYTEHHDVINEWNGYWRFDRTSKETGVGALVDGMTLRDFHSPFYVAVGRAGSESVRAGATVQVPLYASFLADGGGVGDSLLLRTELYGWNSLGERRTYATSTRRIPYRPWLSAPLEPLAVTMPDQPAVVVLAVRLEDAAGTVLHHNFTTFVVEGTAPAQATLADGRRARVSRVGAGDFAKAEWSRKTWTVLDGLKADGTGSGYFEYRIPWPAGLRRADVAGASFLVEASAKQLFGKDRDSTTREEGDYMRGGGFQDPSRNRNSYPMTDETKYPSAVTVRVAGRVAGRFELADDPADHRGILSWHSQKRDRFLREAGSYGELLRVAIPDSSLDAAAKLGEVVVRLEVSDALPGGLAIYGAKFGRYPVDPTVLFILKDQTDVAGPR